MTINEMTLIVCEALINKAIDRAQYKGYWCRYCYSSREHADNCSVTIAKQLKQLIKEEKSDE